jgi:hypothetical protein
MSTGGSSGGSLIISKRPWLAYLDEDIVESGNDASYIELPNIMKDMLLSASDATATEAVHRIDTFYSESYLSSDPLMRLQDDAGMAGFLSSVHSLIFDMGKLIPYSDRGKTCWCSLSWRFGCFHQERSKFGV